ncbi:MAG: hypothetical protein U0470_02710 [Anaerolineae bacterium]
MQPRPVRFGSRLILVLGLMACGAALSMPAAAAVRRGPAARPQPPTATPVPTATAEPCSGCPTLHVDTVNINAWADSQARTLAAGCFVTITDESGHWIDGAAVTIAWSGQLSGSTTATTALTGDGGYAEAYFFNSVAGRCRSGGRRSHHAP